MRRLEPRSLIDSLSRLNHVRAQVNSILRIASPAGITTIAGPGVMIIRTPIATTVTPTTPMTMRRAALYVKCIALRINIQSSLLDFAAACRSLAAMQAINVRLILALSLGILAASVSADDILRLDANEAEAKIQPRDEATREIRLPDVDFPLIVNLRCPADTSAESLTISIADTQQHFGKTEIAGSATIKSTVTVPASQLAPVSAKGFCLEGEVVATEFVVVPGVAAAHASLRCRSGSGISVHFASSVAPVRLFCPTKTAQVPPADR